MPPPVPGMAVFLPCFGSNGALSCRDVPPAFGLFGVSSLPSLYFLLILLLNLRQRRFRSPSDAFAVVESAANFLKSFWNMEGCLPLQQQASPWLSHGHNSFE